MTKEYFEKLLKLVKELEEPYKTAAQKKSKMDFLQGYLEGGIQALELTNSTP